MFLLVCLNASSKELKEQKFRSERRAPKRRILSTTSTALLPQSEHAND